MPLKRRRRRKGGRFANRGLAAMLFGMALIIGSFLVAVVVLDMLSASRAFVAAESQWSKAHQSAIFHLDRYAETGYSEHLLQARENLRSPLMDRGGRLALDQQSPDLEEARRQLQMSSADEADAPRVIRLYSFFGSLPYFNEAIRLWRESDTWILALAQLANELEAEWRAEQPGLSRIRSVRAELAMIHATLSQKASEFSHAIADGSRRLSELAMLTTIIVLSILAAASMLLFLWALRGIRLSRNRFWNTFEQAPVGMALIDIHGTMLETNESLARFLERERDELIGKPLFHFCESRDRALTRKVITDPATTGRRLVGIESRFSRPDGTQAWGRLSVASIDPGKVREPIHVAVIEDVSEARGLSRELAYQAIHDQLTGLPNRREFERQMNHLLHDRERNAARHALCLIDLDQFKIVNETLGHLAGDALLVRLTEKIRLCLRDEDLLARLDGDEFGIILTQCDIGTATRIAERISDAVSSFRFGWENRSIQVTTSIGLVEIDHRSVDSSQLLQQLDMACHAAKDQGRNQIQVYARTRKSSRKRQKDMGWVSRINDALISNRLRFHGQLIAPAVGDEWRCELLLRLCDEDGALHPAAEFIHAAEHYHTARTIDRWVVENALQQIRLHQRELSWVRHWHINLSGQSVDCEAVLPEIIDQILSQGVPPDRLCFEITESAAMRGFDEARGFFEGLRALGCEVALDDFGKGLSTFDYLKKLPLDLVKIDGGFVRELAYSELDHAMVRSIHEVARVAGNKTIAESVESIELIMRLKQIGIDFLQGHVIHSPEPLFELKAPMDHPPQ